ncbi:MAG: DUF2065 domain-containing protein [Gammaproteobacteria bacterium]|nr:DUF2065 domain-containing protein [Gammaproteobacteria bacterium]
MWHDLLVATALLLVVEGILPFINPIGLRKVLIILSQMDDNALRFGGLTSMILGVILLYFINVSA